MTESFDFIAGLLGEWSVELSPLSALLRIVVAVVLAGVIGCERSVKRHSAGLRTFILVSLSTCTAVLLDLYFAEQAGTKLMLLSAASIVAVSIICVNSTFYSSRSQIKGLTTSVGLWACGMLGIAAGAGCYTITLISFVGLICILAILPNLEVYLKNRSNHFEVHLELVSSANLRDFVTTIRKLGMVVDDIEANPAYHNSGLSVYMVAVSISNDTLRQYKTHGAIIEALKSLDYIYHIEEIH